MRWKKGGMTWGRVIELPGGAGAGAMVVVSSLAINRSFHSLCFSSFQYCNFSSLSESKLALFASFRSSRGSMILDAFSI